MPKSRIPAIEIKLGGETRRLMFTHHALGELEEAAAELKPGSRIKSMILMLWAGLLSETLDEHGNATARTLSRYQISKMLDAMTPAEIDAIAEGITNARTLAEPPAEDRPTEPPAQA